MKNNKCKRGFVRKGKKCVKRDKDNSDDDSIFIPTILPNLGIIDGIGTGLPP